jgi:histidinol-phosphate phosphatase family protein
MKDLVSHCEQRGPWEVLLVDRDGLLIENHPYLSDPSQVIPISNVAEALTDARNAGLRIVVISNQSGIARNLLSWTDLRAVNKRVNDLLGPFEAWYICPPLPEAGCECRKPSPGMILQAAEELHVPAHRCLMVGDRLSDVQAGGQAGTSSALIPASETPNEEIALAPRVFASLRELVWWMTQGYDGHACE